MKRLLTLGLLALVLASPALGQIPDEDRWGVGVDFGYWKGIDGDRDYSNVDQLGRFYVRHGLTRSLSLDLGLKYGWLRPGVDTPADDAGVSLDAFGPSLYTRIWQPALTAVYHLVPDGAWRPWVSGGVGVTRWDVIRDEDPGLWPNEEYLRVLNEDGEEVWGHDVNVTALLGIGLDYAFGDHLSAGIAARTNILLDQSTDNIGMSHAAYGFTPANEHVDANTQLLEVTAGLRYMFGGAAEPAPAPAPPPPPAPAPPPPPPPPAAPADADRDGINDDADQCPDEAEDKDGFEDQDGCPDPDNDGDGVLDAADRCPNTPRDVEVDDSGCPVAKEIKAALVLEGVNFKTSSAELDAGSAAILDGVVASLKAWPEVKIEVGGHTDSSGSAELNKKLSQARADTVRQYLIDKGIAADRLTAVGYGEDKPIADNDTPAGKAKNRRVELNRTN